MQEKVIFAIVTGAAGSLFATFIIYVGQTSRDSLFELLKRNQIRQKEKDAWATREIGIRQGITNHYTFQVLRYLLLGNLFWVVPEAISPVLRNYELGQLAHMCFLIIGLVFFLLGTGKALRYLSIRRTDSRDLYSPVKGEAKD